MTMTKIETVTLGSAQASIDFNSISGSFTDLLLVASIRSARSAAQDTVAYKFNASTSGYSYRQLYGGAGSGSIVTGGDSASPAYQVLGVCPAANNTANTFGSQNLYIPNYAGSKNKSTSSESVAENNASTNFQLDLFAGIWTNTSAITSISLFSTTASNFAIGSTATLYGILKGSGGATVS